MMRKLFIGFIALFCGYEVSAQNYFQQEVNYDIEVSLDDKNNLLIGFETFEYINNSQDALPFIYIHLWPNAYKNGKTALAKQAYRSGDSFMFYALSKDLGYIDSLDFKVDGKAAKWEFDSEHIDICKLFLHEPLKPGDKVEVSTPFKVKIPSGKISRLGHIGESFQITQWYPKPAVYDKDGWHQMPYLGQGEFYSEYGSYDVKITLPDNYIVGSTGDFVNCDDEMAMLEEKSSMNPGVEPTTKSGFPVSSSTLKTLHYHQENVHDFAWFADKRFQVLKGSVVLPHSGRTVTTWAMYTPENAELWDKSLEYLHDAVYYYSLWNGDYPYNQVTAVDGTISEGGGMEYPNVTVIGEMNSAIALDLVITHEVGHNWFYGILGSNERDNPWMDEGINSFNENRYMIEKYDSLKIYSGMLPDKVGEILDLDRFDYKAQEELFYLWNATRDKDQAISCHSDKFTPTNYGAIVYKKTAVVFDYLMAYLGEDLFDQCMQTYFEEWKFKHPEAKDLRKIFEDKTGKDLSWFFDDMINTTGKLDFSMKKVKNNGDSFDITVKNDGDFSSPFSVSVLRNDSVLRNEWFEGMEVGEKKTVSVPANKGDIIKLDALHKIPEISRRDNTSKTKGLFKKIEPIEVKLLTRLQDPDKSQMFWIPLLAWNEYNHMMAGVNIHNVSVPLKRFEYSFSPLYSFSKKNLNGFARMSWFKESWELGVKAQKFNHLESYLYSSSYDKISPYITFSKRKNLEYNKGFKIQFQSDVINIRNKTKEDVLMEGQTFEIADSYRIISSINYSYHEKTVFKSWNLSFDVKQIVEDWGNYLYPVSFTGNYSKRYNKKGSDIKLRFFAGKFIESSNTNLFNWQSGGQTGAQDYSFDDLYLGRTEQDGLLSQQITSNHGGLRKPFGITSNNWITSLMLDFELPTRLPLSIFAGGSLLNSSDDNSNITYADYNAGISIRLGIGRINIPLVYREMFDDSYEGEIKFGKAINFELYLHEINPFSLLRNAAP